MAVARAPRRLLTATAPLPKQKEQPRAELRVVGPAPRSALVTTACAVAALFVVFFALVVFHTVMLQNQQRLDRLDDQVEAAQSKYEHLRLEVAQLEAPQRVVDAATQKLGMVPAAGTTYLTPSSPEGAEAPPTTPDATDTGATDTGTTGPPPDDSEWPRVKPYLGSSRR